MLASNTILQNRYRIVRELGHGGMGSVYVAIDQRVNCIVALKETQLSDSGARKAFEREAALLANLRHQALPKVMDYFSENEGDFLVMEFIPGYDLAELLELRGSPFPQSQVLRWADDLLRVLEYLHGQDPPILHRDIKPANLKLTRAGEVFLLDFGLAKGSIGQMPTMATNRSVHGYTRDYAALEQILLQGTDGRSDLYSLGATLYHIISGVAPIDAAKRFQRIEDGEPDPLQPIQKLNPQATPSVAAVIEQAMAMSRKQRPISAAEMRKALRSAAEEDERSSGEQEYRRAEAKRRQLEEDQRIAGPNAAAGVDRFMLDLSAKEFAPIEKPSPIPKTEPTRKATPKRNGSPPKAADNEKVGGVQPAKAPDTVPSSTQLPSNPPASLRRFEFVTATLTSSGRLKSRDRKSAYTFTENLGGDIKLDMVAIPPGEFMMGSPEYEAARGDDEGPQHQVRIGYWFYIGKSAISQAQWRAVMGTNPSHFKNCDECPVERVSWDDAQEFCSKLSARTGKKYRLPSEAEWEYAARSGTTMPFAFGDTVTPEIVNFDGNYPYGNAAEDTYREKTVPIASLGVANGFGLSDTHGNVWEWCQDWYHESYTAITGDAPSDGNAWLVGGDQKYRVLRGGSWYSIASSCRSAARYWYSPDFRLIDFGFRVVVGPEDS